MYALGDSVNAVYQNLLDGVSGIRPVTRFPIDAYATKFGGQIPNEAGMGAGGLGFSRSASCSSPSAAAPGRRKRAA